ncbi:MAG: cytochrome-c peroxidase [Gammaproteobacteria bacterium]|nr:cytochrome-c peroxidase [Gammaproteobacteria bacterium]
MSNVSRHTRPWMVTVIAAVLIALAYEGWQRYVPPAAWSDDEIDQIASLWIGRLPPLPPDPTNAVADNPQAAAFGHRLFFDGRLSANGMISCSTCHQPIRRFTDGLPKAVAIGQAKRNTPSIVGTAYSPWLYWDGRKDSQWAQAVGPMEDPAEHGGTRTQYAHLIARHYAAEYRALFGALPDLSDRARFPDSAGPFGRKEEKEAWMAMTPDDRDTVNRIFAGIGKAIAAYERLLLPGESRFDQYVEHVLDGGDHLEQDFLGRDEIRGLRLFITDARCTECHNGPLLTNNEFHNTGLLSAPGDTPDRGRIDGVREVMSDPFNCLGPYNDDPDPTCAELRYARTGVELIGATRTPSLRNLKDTAPFQHKGQLANLNDVLRHYDQAPLAMIGHNEAKELYLRDWELRALEAFLNSLSAPVATDEKWLQAP